MRVSITASKALGNIEQVTCGTFVLGTYYVFHHQGLCNDAFGMFL